MLRQTLSWSAMGRKGEAGKKERNRASAKLSFAKFKCSQK
jgi:hypothetical protein